MDVGVGVWVCRGVKFGVFGVFSFFFVEFHLSCKKLLLMYTYKKENSNIPDEVKKL